MNLQQAFDEIFRAVVQSVEENLNVHNFEFDLDGNGNFHTDFHPGRKTIHCILWIKDPNVTYTITITSSDEGGGHWEKVHVNDQLKFDIPPSLEWHKTVASMDVHATVANQKGHGVIEFTFSS